MKKLATSSILALTLALLSACAPADQTTSSSGDDIIGGTMVVPGSPLAKQVFMIYMVSNGGGGLCTATMISETVGLTAAHCMDEARSGYAVFSIDAISKLKNAGGRDQLLKDPRVIQLSKIRVFPTWTGSIDRGNNGDVALFKLSKPKPSDIEITQLHTEALVKGQTVVSSGYGINSGALGFGSGLLRETRVRVLNPNVTQTEFSVDQKQASGVCSGDSGGPSFVISPFGRYKQAGIVSYGETGCEVSGVYTNVVPYIKWIYQTAASM